MVIAQHLLCFQASGKALFFLEHNPFFVHTTTLHNTIWAWLVLHSLQTALPYCPLKSRPSFRQQARPNEVQ
jgi:hypothetical protein